MDYADLERKWGSASNIARALGVDRQLVNHWRRAGISYSRQCFIQIQTNGRMRAEKPAEPKNKNKIKAA